METQANGIQEHLGVPLQNSIYFPAITAAKTRHIPGEFLENKTCQVSEAKTSWFNYHGRYSVIRHRRRLRTIFSSRQLEILEQAYFKSKYPDICAKKEIAKQAGLPSEKVQIWFQNKRTRDKKLKEDKSGNKDSKIDSCNKKKIHSSDKAGKQMREIDYSCRDVYKNENEPDEEAFSKSKVYEGSTTNQKLLKMVDGSSNNVLDKSSQQFMTSLDDSASQRISPSFIRYLQQQLRLSPSDAMESLIYRGST